jgi:adenylate kinase
LRFHLFYSIAPITQKKLDFQQTLEQYLEEEKIHDIFGDMMKALVKERPENPIEFLIEKLKQPERKRIVLILPPGLKQNQEDTMNVALMLHNHLKEDLGIADIKYISVSDLLVREINKRSEYGKLIYDCRKNYQYIKDEIVIDLVQNHIEECERNNQGWILEGFPRTRMQALALQNMKIIPDKIFLLNCVDNVLFERLNQKLFLGVGATF